MHDAGPVAPLEKARHGAIDQVARFAGGFFEKIAQPAADDLLEAQADEIGEAAIDGAHFAIEGEGEKHVVERVDQVPVALLGALDDGEELIHLLVAGRRGVALLDASDQAAKLGYFLSALPGIQAE